MMKPVAILLAFVCIVFPRAALSENENENENENETTTAPEIETAALFRASLEALRTDHPADAVAGFETLADRGNVDPVLSYDRGLAYAARVRAGAERPGDLGRAVQAFEEARDLSRDPALHRDATSALLTVRAEIARRAARTGLQTEVQQGHSLGQAFVGIAPESTWTLLAALASAGLAMGIVVRSKTRSSRLRVAGATTATLSLLGLVMCFGSTVFARHLRLHARDGVVLTTARLLDKQHIVQSALLPLAEGTRVAVVEDGTDFARVRIREIEGFLPVGTLAPLAKP